MAIKNRNKCLANTFPFYFLDCAEEGLFALHCLPRGVATHGRLCVCRLSVAFLSLALTGCKERVLEEVAICCSCRTEGKLLTEMQVGEAFQRGVLHEFHVGVIKLPAVSTRRQ